MQTPGPCSTESWIGSRKQSFRGSQWRIVWCKRCNRDWMGKGIERTAFGEKEEEKKREKHEWMTGKFIHLRYSGWSIADLLFTRV